MTKAIHLIGAIAILAALLGFASDAGPVSAASPQCSITARQPYDNGPQVVGTSSGLCIGSSFIVAQQTCLYRNNVAIKCSTLSTYSQSVSWSVVVQQYGGGYATYQTWGWIKDSLGYTEGSWSATAYLGI